MCSVGVILPLWARRDSTLNDSVLAIANPGSLLVVASRLLRRLCLIPSFIPSFFLVLTFVLILLFLLVVFLTFG